MEQNPVISEQKTAQGVVKTKTFSAILLSRIFENNYQVPGTLTAELKQTVDSKSIYPGKTVSSNMQDNIFGADEFDFEPKTYENTSTRVAFLEVPASLTEEQVKARVLSFKDAVIYQVVSNHPILTNKQEAGIEAGKTTLDIISESQVMRYGADNEKAGQLILDELGRPIYRATYFSSVKKEDDDRRKFLSVGMSEEEVNSVKADFYASLSISEEIGS